MDEQAVIVEFQYDADSLEPLWRLTEQLEAALAATDVGELDGNDLAPDGSEGTLYLYGPDADALFAVASPVLVAAGCLRDARVTLRYGDPDEDAFERVVPLTE